MPSMFTSPAEFLGKIFHDQVLVEWTQGGDVRLGVILGIKIVRIELADPVEHLPILVVHQELIIILAVRRIEGMIPDHVESFSREMIFDDMIEVFVVSPGEVHLVQPATFCVNADSRLETWLAAVGIVAEILMKDDIVRPGTADREGIPYDGPLRFSKKTKDFAEI